MNKDRVRDMGMRQRQRQRRPETRRDRGAEAGKVTGAEAKRLKRRGAEIEGQGDRKEQS